MILNGGEVKALSGAVMIQQDVPFPEFTKPKLSPRERRLLERADSKLVAAQQSMAPQLPRDTPGWLDLLLNSEREISFTTEEVRILERVANACLTVLPVDDQHLSALVGLRPRGIESLRAAHRKLVLYLDDVAPSNGKNGRS